MRRLALAIAITSFHAAPALAQSQVQHVPSPTPDDSSSSSPVPGGSDPTHPPTPNPAEPLRFAKPDSEPPLPVRPASIDRDELTGHLRLGLAGAFGTLSGSFLESSGIGSKLAGSPFFLGDLGVGISRHLEVLVAGDYSSASHGSSCSSCRATSWAIGPMLRYQLVEGTRFSPWLALGAAYRKSSLEGYDVSSVRSIEFLRLQLGGDWFALSNIAVGPVLGLGVAASFDASKGDDERVFALFYGGLRLLFDVPGR